MLNERLTRGVRTGLALAALCLAPIGWAGDKDPAVTEFIALMGRTEAEGNYLLKWITTRAADGNFDLLKTHLSDFQATPYFSRFNDRYSYIPSEIAANLGRPDPQNSGAAIYIVLSFMEQAKAMGGFATPTPAALYAQGFADEIFIKYHDLWAKGSLAAKRLGGHFQLESERWDRRNSYQWNTYLYTSRVPAEKTNRACYNGVTHLGRGLEGLESLFTDLLKFEQAAVLDFEKEYRVPPPFVFSRLQLWNQEKYGGEAALHSTIAVLKYMALERSESSPLELRQFAKEYLRAIFSQVPADEGCAETIRSASTSIGYQGPLTLITNLKKYYEGGVIQPARQGVEDRGSAASESPLSAD